MPIVRIKEKLVYFAHVPKCAGTAVERYLIDRFGPLGFRDQRFFTRPQRRRWSRSSPQHIDTATLAMLLPESFFAAQFALVRHPVPRLISVYRFQRDIEHTIDEDTDFETWLGALSKMRSRRPFAYDNHIRPMTEIVPEGATVFRLEAEGGADQIVPWLDEIAGDTELPRSVPQMNTYAGRIKAAGLTLRDPPECNAASLAIIRKLYATDFERVGYSADDCPESGSQ